MSPTQQISRKARRSAARAAAKSTVKTPPSHISPALPTWQAAAICVVLAVGTLALYSPVGSHPFINFDDPLYVAENPHVQEGLNWQTISWAMAATDAANWHPLAWLSHALDFQLYGMNAGGHHWTNVILHTLNVLLLFAFLRRATGAPWRSTVAAALFALHPVNVESVAWVAERKSLLSLLFFLLALWAYVWYAEKPSWKRYSAVALAFIMALASKPMAITFPFLLLVLDYWPLGRIRGWTSSPAQPAESQRSWHRLAVEKIPLLLLSAASAVITVIAQSRGNSVSGLDAMPLSWRLGNAVYSYAMYLAKIFWPVDLALVYPHPRDTLTAAQIAICVLLLAGISALVWRQRVQRPYALTGWLWFLGTLVPVIGIVQVGAQGMADRYLYLPAIGIFLLVVWTAADLIAAARLDFRLAAALSVTVLATLSAVTFRQIGYWRSSFDLWRHTLEVTHDNFFAEHSMGDLLMQQGDPDAIKYFQAAANLAPWDTQSHAMVAGYLHDRGELQQALVEYSAALRAHPDPKLRAHIDADVAVIYRQLGDQGKAREFSRQALASDADEVQNMIQQLSATLTQRPEAPGYWLLGAYLEGAGRIPEAKAAYQQALQLAPSFAPASQALHQLEN